MRALRAGAAGYLTKAAIPEQVIAAITKVARGGRYVSESFAERLVSEMERPSVGAPHERLSDREFEVLKALASGRTVSQIATDLALSVKTVSTHRTRILKKLGLTTTAELIRYAIQHRLID